MSQRFTTEILPAADRIDAWRWNAQQICGDCRIKLPKSSFHGSIEVRTLGALKLTRFSSSPVAFWKWPGDMLKEENRACVVITQLAGRREYMQNGRSVLLNAGDSTVIDSARPWCSTCTTDCTRLYFRVPRWMMENCIRSREIPIAERISGNGLGATLCRLSLSLYEEAERMSEQESVAALDAFFGILAACVTGRVAAELPGQTYAVEPEISLRKRIRQFIETHLSEATIRPTEVASALGISVRHLHRSFSESGNSVGEYIRSRRLEECRKDLANPRLRGKTITEIAFFWGFSDSAHFSRAFAREFGTSPREFRAESAARTDFHLKYGRLRHALPRGVSDLNCIKPN